MAVCKKAKWIAPLGGLLAGVINGLLGAAGGLIVVPALRASGTEPTRAHATSVAIVLPLCVASVLAYRGAGFFAWADALPYLPGGLLGAGVGAWLLPKLPASVLRRVFGAFMLWAAFRLLVQ